MGTGRFLRDSRFPSLLWAIYDHESESLVERVKSKSRKEKSYVKIYKSREAADNFIKLYLNSDYDRFEIYEYSLNAPK